ncbi:hypothetical protein [Nostoc sp.]|uniref:hypothetical protein n=1 Tax=Nostoc sp. TaxID=1180 RepID=UPI0026B82047
MKRQDSQQTLRLSSDLRNQVLQVCDKNQMTAAEVIRAALVMYLKEQLPQDTK